MPERDAQRPTSQPPAASARRSRSAYGAPDAPVTPRKTLTDRRLRPGRPCQAAYGCGTGTRTACGTVAAVLAAWLALPAVALAQSDEPSRNLGELWQEYPLFPAETTTPEPEQAQPEQPPPAETVAVTTNEAGGNTGLVVVVVAGVAGVAALVLLAALLLGRARRTQPQSARPETAQELIARAYALASEAAECDKFIQGQREEGVGEMTETAGQHGSAAAAPPSESSSTSYADIGERVAGVLAAAEAAANQIRDDARLLADELLSAAREEADAVRSDASSYDTDTRAAVESYASDRRREVDQEVARQLTDSEAQARATRQAAEAMARQIEDEARRRGQALRDESSAVEERLKKAAAGLRRMTSEIEELLGASRDGESLTDALKPYSQRPEADEPAPASHANER
jgi:hypothetical protein